MSILIKGLDMPKDGEILTLEINNKGEVTAYSTELKEIETEPKAIQIERPHGRLIDIDEVPKYNIVSRPLREGWNEALKYIDEFVPTILESED